MNRFLVSFTFILALALAGSASAQVAPGVRINAKTATATLDRGSDIGRGVLITNTGASGAIVLTLPDCDSAISTGAGAPSYAGSISTVGMEVNVLLTAAQDVDLNPADTTDTITGMGTLPSTAVAGAGGDAISSAAAIGNGVTLTCVADDKWVISNANGAWADVN